MKVGLSSAKALAGRFDVIRLLGSGGSGVVYEAIDRSTGSRVALKMLRDGGGLGLYRLKNEFRLLQDLSHPNLIALHELVEDEGQWLVVMEYLDGTDFLTHVGAVTANVTNSHHAVSADNSQGYDEARLRSALAQVLRGVRALHSAGKVHRDIKPSNVMVTREGRAVLLDFGLATDALEARQSLDGNAVGTALYMAPEQAASKAVTPAADLYALGVMLFEALTDQLPFPGGPLQVMLSKQSATPPSPRSIRARVPEDLDRLCTAMLSRRPEDRPTAAQALGVVAGEQVNAEPYSSSGRLSVSDVVIGRETEWATFEATLERFTHGAAQGVLLLGESGIGKSTLLQTFCMHAERALEQLVVLSGRCYERESVPYKGFDGVIDELARHMRKLPPAESSELLGDDAPLLTRIFPVLGRILPKRAPSAGRVVRDEQELRAQAFAALRRVLTELSSKQRVVVWIDDLQWADPDSVNLLLELFAGDKPPRVLLLLSARADVDVQYDAVTPVRNALARMLRPISLGPLEPRAAETLATTLLMRFCPQRAALAAAVAREARGHPLYIAELVQYAAVAGLEAGAAPRLEDAIWERSHRADPASRPLLCLLGIAAGPMPVEVLARAADLSADECSRQTSTLRVARLVRWTSHGLIEVYHDRIRSAVRAHLEPARVIELHRRLAAALETEVDRPEPLVHHLVASGQRERAASVARAAADRADATLAFDRAAKLYGLVLELGGFAGEERRAIVMAQARALSRVGRCRDAAQAFLSAADGADPETKLDCQRSAAEQFLISGHIDEGLEAMSALMRAIGIELPKTPRMALLSLVYNRIALRFRGLDYEARRASQLTHEQLVRVDALQAVSHGLAMVDNIRGADFNARFLRVALDTGELSRIALALGTEAVFLASQGGRGIERALRLTASVSRIATENEDAFFRAWAKAAAGVTRYFMGDFADSARLLGEAVELYRMETSGRTFELNNSRMFVLFSLHHLGRLREVRERLSSELADSLRRGDRYLETSLRRYCSFLYLAADDPEGARANLDAARWVPPEGRFHLQHWYELEARGELALYEGVVPDTLERSFELMDRSMIMRVQIVRCLSMWLRARHDLAFARGVTLQKRLRRAHRLASKLEREGIEYARVWGKLILGGIHEARGERDAADQAFARAEEHAEKAQMQLMRATAQRRRGEVLGDGGDALRAEADAWLRGQGVQVPSRFVAVYAPRVAYDRIALPANAGT